MRTITAQAALAVLLASTAVAGAQVPRNGPEWGGKDHQPTQAEVVGRENRAGVRAPPSQVQQDEQTLKQLDQQLLHDEAVDPPRNLAPPIPP